MAKFIDPLTECNVKEQINCESCEKDGNIYPADTFCCACIEYFCGTCIKFHARYLSDHKLTAMRDIPEVFPFECCDVHPAEKLKYFCRMCELLVCPKCEDLSHKDCQPIESVLDVVHDYKSSDEVKNFIESLKHLVMKTDQVNKYLNTSESETMHKEALDAIKLQRENINKIFDDLEENLSNEVEKVHTDNMKQIAEVSKKADLVKQDLNKLKCLIDYKKSSGTNKDLFMTLYQEKSKFDTIKKEIEKAEEFRISKYKYQSSESVNISLKSISNLGEIVICDLDSGSSQRNVSLLENAAAKECQANEVLDKQRKGIFTKMSEFVSELVFSPKTEDGKSRVFLKSDLDAYASTDKNTSNITGCCFVPKSCLVVADDANVALKVISTDKGRVVHTHKLECKPWDVTYVVDMKQIAVTFPTEGKVCLFDFKKTGTMNLSSRFEPGRHCRSIAYNRGCLIVSFGNILNQSENKNPDSKGKIQIFDTHGNVLQTFTEHSSGKSLFAYPSNLAVTHDHNSVYVTDLLKARVLKLKLDGTLELIIKYDILKEPRGIAVDGEGTLYICDFASDDLHIIRNSSNPSTALRLAGSSLSGLSGPRCLAFNDEKRQLYITMHARNAIKVIELK